MPLLAVDHDTRPSQQDVQLAITEPATLLRGLAQFRANLGIIIRCDS